MRSKTTRWNPKSFANSICEKVSMPIHDLTQRQARSLERYLAHLTATNCWWAVYNMRGVVGDFIATYHPARKPAPAGKEKR